MNNFEEPSITYYSKVKQYVIFTIFLMISKITSMILTKFYYLTNQIIDIAVSSNIGIANT